MARDVVQGMGFTAGEDDDQGCRWVAIRHGLTVKGNDHLHIAVNLVRQDGRRAPVADASAQGERRAVSDTMSVATTAGKNGPFALVGASLGGRVVIEAAARHPTGLKAIVSLSGERSVEDYRDILPQARRVDAPALYVGARDDFYANGTVQQRQLHQAMHGHPNELLQRDGLEHGVQLIDQTQGADKATAERVVGFLNRLLSP